MAIDQLRMAQVALKLIKAEGRAVQLLRINRTPADAEKPWRGSGANANIFTDATAAFMDPVSEKALGRSDTRGPEDSVVRGFQIAFLASAENPGVDYTLYDRLLDNGVFGTGLVYTMEVINLLAPGEIPLLWEIEVTR